MVYILCPHCEEEIELEDDASGVFACPYCEGEFEWNMDATNDNNRSGSTRGNTAKTDGGIPPIHPVEWVGHGLSIFILIFVILCLSSGSLYSVSAGGTDGQQTMVLFDLSYGLNEYSGEEFGMSVSSSYADEIADLEAERADLCEYLPDDCSTHNANEIEVLESWEQAGNYLGFFAIIALLCSIAVVIFRFIHMLDRMEIMLLNERMYVASTYGKMFLPFFISGFLLIGMILFMILSPGANMYQELLGDEFPSAALSSGFGIIVWLSLILSVGYSVFSIFEINVE